MGENEIDTSGQPLYKICRRCGRKLKSLECRQRGYGPVCWERQKNLKRVKKLFTFS